jgi:hypothetical protein
MTEQETEKLETIYESLVAFFEGERLSFRQGMALSLTLAMNCASKMGLRKKEFLSQAFEAWDQMEGEGQNGKV